MPVDTSQVEAFAARLVAASLKVEPAGEAWEATYANQVADEMRSLAPRRSGDLIDSIQVTPDGRVVVGVDYGRFVEYGTSRMAPQPFMRPAVDRVEPDAQDAAAEMGKTII
jgi:HK97 gp10 family phage protein